MSKTVLIVGGGPAGLAAAIQLHRSHIPVVVFEARRLAAQVYQAHRIENVLGFTSISGIQLAERLERQANYWQLPIRYERVLKVHRQADGIFWVETASGQTQGSEVILATGTRPNLLPSLLTDLEPDLWNDEGVVDEVTRLHNLKNKHIVIVGSGDVALDGALYLSRDNHVSILLNRDRPKALPLLLKRVSQTPTIKLISWARVTRFQRVDQKIKLEICISGSPVTSLFADRVLVAVGRCAQLPEVTFPIRLQSQGASGCYLAGDVVQGAYRQVGIAMGDGLKVAMMITEARRNARDVVCETR